MTMRNMNGAHSDRPTDNYHVNLQFSEDAEHFFSLMFLFYRPQLYDFGFILPLF